MSTLRVSNIEAKADVSSPTVDEKIKFTNSSGDVLFHLDGKTSGITTVGINTTGNTFTVNNTTGDVSFSGSVTSSGVSTFTSDVSIADKIVHIGDTDTAIRFPAADTITAETGGSERFRIDSSGNYKLITGSGGTLTFGIANGVGTQIQRLLYDDSDGSLTIGGGTATGYPLKFFTGNDERLRITSAGNVGINTANPASALEIVSDVNSAQLRIRASSSGNRAQMRYTNAHSYWETGISGGTSGDFLIAGSTEDTDIVIYTRASGANQSEKIRITSAGLMGLGTASPDNFASNANHLVINDSGNGGLTIATGSSSNGHIFFADGTTGDQAYRGIIKYEHGNDAMTFGTAGGTERLRINSSGNMGLGVTPESWGTNFRAFQIGSTGSLASQVGARTIELATNAYNNSGWKYTDSDVASLYYQYNGEHIFANAPSGTDDASCTFTERLRIDSAGHVTKPSQPCFLAYRSSTQTYSANNTVVFDTEIFDNNSDYDTSNGNFTAPVTGRYLILATVLVQSISQGNSFDLQLDTSNRKYYGAPGRIESQLGTTWGNDYIALAVQQIVDMDANDVAFIKFTTFEGGSIYGNTGSNMWTRFSAYLLC